MHFYFGKITKRVYDSIIQNGSLCFLRSITNCMKYFTLMAKINPKGDVNPVDVRIIIDKFKPSFKVVGTKYSS